MQTHVRPPIMYLGRRSMRLLQHQSTMLVRKYGSIRRSQATQTDWLRNIFENSNEPPRLYAWTSANLKIGSSARKFTPMTSEFEPKSSSGHRIYILGIGNVGRLFASSLAKQTNKPPITLVVHRKALLEQWVSSPAIEMTRFGEVERTSDFDVEWWTEEKPSTGPVLEATDGAGIDNLIVATKAPDALPQVDRLRGYLSCRSTVAFTQNGMCKLWPPNGDMYINHRFSKGQGPNWIACVNTQ
ncbi:ketopantoate reductase PanE/ApbA-domain-containing protein [Xylariales sp. AK1849]|nr:ketopantoate reductase PanE/ApbA-domain-containing protein [Xylariales sp. AK1849]